MIPTLTKPGLAELPPKSAYDKLAFIEAHYDEICEMYQTIMEHLKLPQVENNSGSGNGSGVEYITHEYQAKYIDIYISTNQLPPMGYTVEEAILKIPYRSYILYGTYKWTPGGLYDEPFVFTHSAKCKYQGTKNLEGTDYYIFRFPKLTSYSSYTVRHIIGIFQNFLDYNEAKNFEVSSPAYASNSYSLDLDRDTVKCIGSSDQQDTFTEVYVKGITGGYTTC